MNDEQHLKTLLTDLPECIHNSFQNYLTKDDYQQLLNTSKKDFIIFRRKTIIFRLTIKHSIQYCEDGNFRKQLLKKVDNPLKQIIVQLIYSKIQFHKDLFDAFPVHLICISFPIVRMNPYISLRNIKEFTLDEYDLDITSLLNISQCERVVFQACQGIIDISPLKDCEHVTLDNCENITDFRSLGLQTSLFIKDNPHLMNVVNFHSIQTLILRDCCILVDVSPLRGVYDLSLIECTAVTDISGLGGHHRLEISSCSPMLSGYDALKDISIVKLVECDISDVSVLSNAKVVSLMKCGSLVDISSLKGVKELTLRDCSKIEDISMLRNVQRLTLHHLPHLKNYEGVNQMKNLTLQLNYLKDDMFQRFPNVKNLQCSSASSYLFFFNLSPLLPSFTNLHSLTISHASVYQPIKIEVCVDIHTVILEHSAVKNISGLGKNRVVRLFHCEGDVLDVSSLATVALVSIIKCRFQKANYESLMNVPRLKIDGYV